MTSYIDFKSEFNQVIEYTYKNGLEWELVGILTKDTSVYTLSYDSKILSGIFEILCEPLIFKIAEKKHMIFEKAKQNQYPEFTIYFSEKPYEKIAVDVKSTYRQFNEKGELKPFYFTLGSYRSYLRDPLGKKGILYTFKDYYQHWVIGFLYTRNEENQFTEIRKIIEASQLKPPFTNIEYFVQEKYKIAGKTPGSGNTTNIGSIRSNNIDVFRRGLGDFSSQKKFEEYWKNY